MTPELKAKFTPKASKKPLDLPQQFVSACFSPTRNPLSSTSTAIAFRYCSTERSSSASVV